jgi:ABC-type glycerol-3-phosphate transport system permease component
MTIIAVIPLLFVVISSLKTPAEYALNPGSFPQNPTLENYAWALSGGKILHFLLNSLIVVPMGLVLYLAVCISAGFAFGKLKFPFRLGIFLGVLFLMIFPQMLLMMQMFKLLTMFGLTNSYIGLALAWVAYFAPFGTYIMTTYFSSVPDEILESARMEGCSTFRILISIMAPIAAPMIGTISIIGLLTMWNELPFSLMLLQDNALRTMTLAVAISQGEYGLNTPSLTAILMLTALVPILIFLFFQKYVTQGATAGALKG